MHKSLSGPDIRRLMRQNKITIRNLAVRMNITLKRVREVRGRGLVDADYCRDWYEAITQTGDFAPKVSLGNGFGGGTRSFFLEPLENDGHLVKLRCADPGCTAMIKWARLSEWQQAAAAQGVSVHRATA